MAQATRNMTQTPLAKERIVNDWYHADQRDHRPRHRDVAKSSDPSQLAATFERR